jgi:hypothetical protein
MPRINIIDDITIPSESMWINFKGKNPFVVCGMFPGMLKEVMKITGKDIWETDLRWDITSDPRPFYGVWMGRRREDKWTTTSIRILAQGAQGSSDKTGWIRVQIKGFVQTEYDYSNFFQKSLWWFYSYMFYYNQRRKYIDYAKDDIHTLKSRTTSALGIYRESA